MTSVLSHMQRSLESLHDVKTELDVEAYLIDSEVRSEIPGALFHVPEQLFVRDALDSCELALYIDASILNALKRDNPFKHLHAHNLEHFCVALEGVSHFVLVAFCGNHGRCVSALEMEIQAEVDKFVMIWAMLIRQEGRFAATRHMFEVLPQLFESYALHDGLSQNEIERYHAASLTARMYCYFLLQRYADTPFGSSMKHHMRRFYRQDLCGKMCVG